MQQRASLVRCLSFDPAVMLLDEPFGALDAFTRDEMNLLLLDLWSEQRKTIVFVTHSILEAIFMADRVLVMTPRPGRLGTRDHCRSAPTADAGHAGAAIFCRDDERHQELHQLQRTEVEQVRNKPKPLPSISSQGAGTRVEDAMADQYLEEIPELRKEGDTRRDAGVMDWTALTSVPMANNLREFLIIAGFAILVVGGAEFLISVSEIPSYIIPLPSAVFGALVNSMPQMLPHIATTLQELLVGYAIGSLAGMVLAGVITQFPLAEKIVTPYVILLVTTPMLALVPLLVLQLGFGLEPRIVAVALAVGPMVMINWLPDSGVRILARLRWPGRTGLRTLQIFRTIRFPIALPMIIVGLMVGGIFGLLTAIGAEMLGGQSGLGTRLVYYSSLARMENFFATILIIAFIGILMYVIFFFIGKRWASWEA